MVNLSVHLCVQTHISVTTGRNVLILSIMMGYGLGIMPLIFSLIWSVTSDPQTTISVSDIDSNGNIYTAAT